MPYPFGQYWLEKDHDIDPDPFVQNARPVRSPDRFSKAELYGPGLWTTANGRILRLEHMSTDHLINVASMLWRLGVKRRMGIIADGVEASWYTAKLREVLRVAKERIQH